MNCSNPGGNILPLPPLSPCRACGWVWESHAGDWLIGRILIPRRAPRKASGVNMLTGDGGGEKWRRSLAQKAGENKKNKAKRERTGTQSGDDSPAHLTEWRSRTKWMTATCMWCANTAHFEQCSPSLGLGNWLSVMCRNQTSGVSNPLCYCAVGQVTTPASSF